MARFENSMGITTIQMEDKVKCYCPIGKSLCTYELSIAMDVGSVIPDYIEVGTFLDEGISGVATLEQCCAEVYDYFYREYQPKYLMVEVRCNDAKHMPVMVRKES